MRKYEIPVIDLHGCSADQVFDLLDRFIRTQKNQERICIIVGKGKGVIKEKTLEYLKQIHYSWKYEVARGVENKGALIVDLY